MIRTIRGGRDDARRFTLSGDIWTRRSASQRGHDSGDRDADHDQYDVDPVQ